MTIPFPVLLLHIENLSNCWRHKNDRVNFTIYLFPGTPNGGNGGHHDENSVIGNNNYDYSPSYSTGGYGGGSGDGGAGSGSGAIGGLPSIHSNFEFPNTGPFNTRGHEASVDQFQWYVQLDKYETAPNSI